MCLAIGLSADTVEIVTVAEKLATFQKNKLESPIRFYSFKNYQS